MMIDCSTLTGRRREICEGVDSEGYPIDVSEFKRAAYLRSWFPTATTTDVADAVFRREREEDRGTVLGLGDRLANGIKRLTRGTVKQCKKCKGRAARLNSLFPAKNLPPVERVVWTEPLRRNCLMHVWPVAGHGSWQWNLDQLLSRAEQFNGRRVVAIATSPDADKPAAVMEHLKDFTDEFIVVPNDRKLREVASWVKLLERVETLDADTVTFCCHAKGVRHKLSSEDEGSTIYRWSEAMYRTCLDDWERVQEHLTTKAMTGSFKRYGQFTTRGNHRWHYSGTFYWFRNRDVFQRNWRHVDRKFFGTESWPGHMFRPEETGCLFMDGADDLYLHEYWTKTIEPALEQWETAHAT